MNDYSAEYTLIGILTAIGLAVVLLLMWWGWRNRKRRQQDIAAPLPVPAGILESEPLAAAEGMYVATVRGQDYLDRIAVHGLGLRTNARLEVHRSGVALLREGGTNLFIPQADLRQVRLDSGMSGKFVEKGGLLVVSWTLGDREVSTGFRTRAADDRDPLLTAVQALVDGESPAAPKATSASSPDA
ncbi:hypothetical protein GCM10010977_21750 [Citricoccus zhacaiensis]|uniref:PH domain-containing protein n=1 Tax=Citricoccus zhacaiensis TaxID=489142 RepID=A0ABQ2M3T8_9MICC|nr:hypothetical protein [Citricoccus zhacaiensis]GGO46546.1 hypothetical protein GCM10010977_21750 [Citricoccus zhacaiensis]